MVWYNPLTWFKTEEGELRCDNPQCRNIIEDDSVAYNAEHQEFYHPGYCCVFANAHRALGFNKGVRGIYETISRRKALQIKKGILEQRVE